MDFRTVNTTCSYCGCGCGLLLEVLDDKVIFSSRRGEIQIKARISRKVNRGVVFIPFHFAAAAANILTNSASDPVAKIPEFKVCAVKVEKLAA